MQIIKNLRLLIVFAFLFIILPNTLLPVIDDSFENSSINSSGWKGEITLDVAQHPYEVYVGDVNNDGFNDIVTADFWSDRYVSVLIWNDIINDWNPRFFKDVGPHPLGVCIGDANNDGYNDIVGTNLNNDEVAILLWNDNIGNWEPKITRTMSYPHDVYVADCNNDGFNDIITDDLRVLLWNNTLKSWDPKISIPAGVSTSSIHVEDANNDGKNDVITIGGGNAIMLCWNDTSKLWDDIITVTVGSSPKSIFSADLNNDGYNDIVTANAGSDDISILLWNENITDWDPEIKMSVGESPESVFIGDANNDGFNDIATANNDNNSISILCWNNTSQDWYTESTNQVGDSPRSIFIDDVNNDGKNDVVAANQISYTVSVFLWQLDAPILHSIHPNPNYNGNIQLKWNEVIGATIYYIYKSTSNISSLGNMLPIDNTTTNNYFDTIDTDGNYYYVVVAGDSQHNGSISNCVGVTVSFDDSLISGYLILPIISFAVIGITFSIKKQKFKK